VEGATASPAENQDTTIPESVQETPVVAENATTPTVEETQTTVDLLQAVAGAVEEGTKGEEAPESVQDTAAGRLAALAALTGAPSTPAPTPAIALDVEPTGVEETWADGDCELVTGVVTFAVFQAVVGGRVKQARKGTTLHATEAVMARGERLGAIVRTV